MSTEWALPEVAWLINLVNKTIFQHGVIVLCSVKVHAPWAVLPVHGRFTENISLLSLLLKFINFANHIGCSMHEKLNFDVEFIGVFEQTRENVYLHKYWLIGTKFWGKYIQKDELKAKFGQNSNIVGTKFMSGLRVGTKLKNVLPRLLPFRLLLNQGLPTS